MKIHFSLPFAYSKNNNETGKLKKGPIFDGDVCGNKKKCGENKKCMKETFLEVSWNACLEGNFNYVYAHTHLSKMKTIFLLTLKYLF